MCPTNRTCRRDCFVVNGLTKIHNEARSTPPQRTATNIDRLRRDSAKFHCPDGSFDMAATRIFKR
jgi:hypothetical protein